MINNSKTQARILNPCHQDWEKMKTILKGYREGTSFNIHMNENGLIWAGEEGKALTWMDAVYNGIAVTPRILYPFP